MTGFAITEVAVPATIADDVDGRYAGSIEVRNAVEAHALGTDETAVPPAVMLAYWQNPNQPKRLLVAELDGRVVARGLFEWSTAPDAVGEAQLTVQVHPDFRRCGIGAALLERVERLAADAGRRKVVTYISSTEGEGERLVPATGAGSLLASDPGVRFLIGHGWRLEQVERVSRFALPADADDLAARRARADAKAGDDYAVRAWDGPTPDRWVDDMAVLLTRMSTDAPSAGLESPEDPWDAARVRERDTRLATAGERMLVAAAEHLPTGRLAGYTELSVPSTAGDPVNQWDTLVLREHRGHGLGMLLKVANLQQLGGAAPGHPSVITFNAEENRFMLDTNEAVGFVAIGAEGAWRKDLP